MNTEQIKGEKWELFYKKWDDFLTKAREAAQEVLTFEAGSPDGFVLSISREAWDALCVDLAEAGNIPSKNYLNKARVSGIKLRKIHMEVINQLVIQDKGLVLVARLFSLPSEIDTWGTKTRAN